MNILLLILLCVFEAAFAVTAGGRKCGKKDWQVGRLICNGGQLLVFLIMLIAPGIDLSFRFMGLTRNQLGSDPPRVRISPSPPKSVLRFFCRTLYFFIISFVRLSAYLSSASLSFGAA